MLVIAMFYGVIVRMFHFDKDKHKAPHFHVQYGEQHAVMGIPAGKLLEGKLKPAKLKLVQAWVEIHREELMADWDLAVEGRRVFKIKPLS